jgi:hypothetical protein
VFVQVIQGTTKEAEALRDQRSRWERDLKPGADGFLGSTGGVSYAGEFFLVARFENEETAQRNSQRPEQDRWWSETAEHLDGEARFYDSTDVDVLLDGGSNDAGFVQVVQGAAKDRTKLEESLRKAEQWLRSNRPELIGGLIVWQDNEFTQVVYFTSEDEARTGEMQEPPPELEEWTALVDDLKFIDLHQPWLSSP